MADTSRAHMTPAKTALGAGQSPPTPSTPQDQRTEWHKASGTANKPLQNRLINQVANTVFVRLGETLEAVSPNLDAELAIMKGIGPRDEIEGMLVAQMVATHNTAMTLMSRAMVQQQTLVGIEQSLKYGVRLMALYAQQIEALSKYRGKGQQKITVEHVTVNAGGQAIVGNIGARAAPAAATAPPPALGHRPGQVLDVNAVSAASRTKSKTAAN